MLRNKQPNRNIRNEKWRQCIGHVTIGLSNCHGHRSAVTSSASVRMFGILRQHFTAKNIKRWLPASAAVYLGGL